MRVTTNDIKLHLKNVLLDLTKSLFNKEISELIKTKAFFAGGCIRDLYRGEAPKDYDLYFVDDESKDKFLELAKNEYSLQKTAINNYNHKNSKSQIITLLTGSPDFVVDRFDFTVNQGYYIPQMDLLRLGSLDSELRCCDKVFSPLNALVRLKKFQDKGFSYDETTLIELGIAVSNMKPITNREEIFEALKGLSAPNIEKALMVSLGEV